MKYLHSEGIRLISITPLTNSSLPCKINYAYSVMFEYCVLMYNLAICVELVLQLYLPLISGQKRNKLYHFCCVAISIALTIMDVQEIKEACELDDESLIYKNMRFMFVILIIYLIVTSLSLALFLYRISKFGMNREQKSLFIKKHTIYCIAVFMLWLTIFISIFIFNEKNAELVKREGHNVPIKQVYASYTFIEKAITLTASFFLVGSGIILSIIRITEPYFLRFIYLSMKKVFSKEENKKPIEGEINQMSNESTYNVIAKSIIYFEVISTIFTAISKSLQIENDSTITQNSITFQCSKPCLEFYNEYNKAKTSSFESHTRPELNHDRKKEYATVISHMPREFIDIRNHAGITNEMLFVSLSVESNFNAIIKSSESKGKSGSYFMFTYDRKFIIKTINETELKNISELIPEYRGHLANQECKTILARIFGVYTLKFGCASSINVIFMENSCPTDEEKIYTFDLKGSTINREEKVNSQSISHAILKDINFINLSKSSPVFVFRNESEKISLFDRIEKDSCFLRKFGLMDYSLLFIIVKSENKKKEDYCFIDESGEKVGYISIIDYLQKYDSIKKMELMIKKIRNGKKAYNTSCIEPISYSNRFINFMRAKVIGIM